MPSNPAPPQTGIRLVEVFAALSLVMDLGLGHQPESSLRACVLATAFARDLGLTEEEVRTVYLTTLLRYVGCTAATHETTRVLADDDIAVNRAATVLDFSSPMAMPPFLLRTAGSGKPPLQRTAALIAALARAPKAASQVRVAHCEVASRLAQRFRLGVAVERALYQISEHWNGRGFPTGGGGPS